MVASRRAPFQRRPSLRTVGLVTLAGTAVMLSAACTTGETDEASLIGSENATTVSTTSVADGSTTGDPTVTVEVSTTAEATTSSTTDEPRGESGGDGSPCEVLEGGGNGRVQSRQLTELSGLAASRRHRDVLWSHNDSGSQPGVFALTDDGGDLGFHPLVGVDAFDIEDITMVDDQLVLADTGDNTGRRDEVHLYSFPEPDPAEPGPVPVVATTTIRYPQGPDDVEGIAFDPVERSLLLFTKSAPPADDEPIAPATVLRIDADALGRAGVVEAEPVATVDTAALAARSGANPLARAAASFYPGAEAVTAADISPDGRFLALRTYATIWVFDREDDADLADTFDAFDEPVCEAPFRLETQGEAVALAAGDETGVLRLITASEGLSSPISETLLRFEITRNP